MFSSALHLEPNFCARVIKKKEGNATAIKNRASAVHIHKRFQGSLADTVLDVFHRTNVFHGLSDCLGLRFQWGKDYSLKHFKCAFIRHFPLQYEVSVVYSPWILHAYYTLYPLQSITRAAYGDNCIFVTQIFDNMDWMYFFFLLQSALTALQKDSNV